MQNTNTRRLNIWLKNKFCKRDTLNPIQNVNMILNVNYWMIECKCTKCFYMFWLCFYLLIYSSQRVSSWLLNFFERWENDNCIGARGFNISFIYVQCCRVVQLPVDHVRAKGDVQVSKADQLSKVITLLIVNLKFSFNCSGNDSTAICTLEALDFYGLQLCYCKHSRFSLFLVEQLIQNKNNTI